MLQCSCSESVNFHVVFPLLSVLFIDRTTVELHAQYYMSLSKPSVTSVACGVKYCLESKGTSENIGDENLV